MKWINIETLQFPRRRAVVRINPWDLQEGAPQLYEAWVKKDIAWLEPVFHACTQKLGLPDGTLLVAAEYNLRFNRIEFYVEHPTFEAVAEGSECPVWRSA